MTPEEKTKLEARWREVESQLEDLRFCKVVSGDPYEFEQKLLGELDEIEFKVGEESLTSGGQWS